MNITRHNCEAVFLDYYEKNLSPVEVAEVLFFLEENPDKRELFERYEAIYLVRQDVPTSRGSSGEHEKINFPDKESLKKKYSREEIDAVLASEINTNNCDQFFVACAEGILSEGQMVKLNSFLVQNPELKKDFELFQKCKLSKEKISFEGKESLKIEPITEQNREEYFIRAIENDLNASGQKALSRFLAKHSEFKKEFELFSKTILPAENIIFYDKSSLKKKERNPVFVSIFSPRTTYYAAAATILLLAGLFLFFRNNDTHQTYMAFKTNTEDRTMVNVKKENSEIESPKSQSPSPNLQENSRQLNDEHSNSDNYRETFEQPKPNSRKQKVKKEEIKLQPVVMEDNENLLAEKEQENLQMMKEEVIAVKKQEEKKDDEINTNQAVASAVTAKSNNEYQTLASFARNKIRSVLGIKQSTECETSDKITMWDLAMAAKTGVQKIIGTKTVDVNKICDGTRNKMEYVFAAGNFEISKNVSK